MFGVEVPPIRFIVRTPDKRKRRVEATSQLIKLGSKKGLVHVPLPAKDAKEIHASVRVAPDGRLWLVDVSNGAGTRLNGTHVERAELFDGDTIGIGKTKVTVRVEGGGHSRDDTAAPGPDDLEATVIPNLLVPSVPPASSHAGGLAVELAPECATVHPGQDLVGTIVLPPAWHDGLEALEICCRWEATEDSAEEQLVSWSCEDLSGGTRSVPFALTAPDGPLSHDGELIAIRWYAQATAIVAGEHRHARTGFVLAPWSEDPILRKVGGYRGGPRRWRAEYRLGPKPPAPGITLRQAGLQSGMLQGVWGGLLRNAQASMREMWLDVDVTMPQTAHAGGPLTVATHLEAKRDVTISQLTCTLTAREFSREADGSWDGALEHVLHEATVHVIDAPITMSAGEDATPEAHIAVPTNAPPSFGADHALLVWTVAINLAVDHCPDWVSEQLVTVLPAPPV